MKQVVSKVRVSDVPELINRLGFSPNQVINLTIESSEDELLTMMERIGKKAQEHGLTEEVLAELLADES